MLKLLWADVTLVFRSHAYNFARRLKALQGLTFDEFIRTQWGAQPERFRVAPSQLMLGSNNR